MSGLFPSMTEQYAAVAKSAALEALPSGHIAQQAAH